jgi:hypothetical protein
MAAIEFIQYYIHIQEEKQNEKVKSITYHHKPETSAVQNGKEKTAARILYSSDKHRNATLEVTTTQHYNQ